MFNLKNIAIAAGLAVVLSVSAFASTTISLKATPSGGKPNYNLTGGDFDGKIGLSGVLTGITVHGGSTFVVDESLLKDLQFGGPAVLGFALRDTGTGTYTRITDADPLEVMTGTFFSIVMVVDPSTIGNNFNFNKLSESNKTGSETWDYFANNTTRGTLTAAAPAVPEPATWLMMILGFGVVAFATRRRQVTAPVTA